MMAGRLASASMSICMAGHDGRAPETIRRRLVAEPAEADVHDVALVDRATARAGRSAPRRGPASRGPACSRTALLAPGPQSGWRCGKLMGPCVALVPDAGADELGELDGTAGCPSGVRRWPTSMRGLVAAEQPARDLAGRRRVDARDDGRLELRHGQVAGLGLLQLHVEHDEHGPRRRRDGLPVAFLQRVERFGQRLRAGRPTSCSCAPSRPCRRPCAPE